MGYNFSIINFFEESIISFREKPKVSNPVGTQTISQNDQSNINYKFNVKSIQ